MYSLIKNLEKRLKNRPVLEGLLYYFYYLMKEYWTAIQHKFALLAGILLVPRTCQTILPLWWGWNMTTWMPFRSCMGRRGRGLACVPAGRMTCSPTWAWRLIRRRCCSAHPWTAEVVCPMALAQCNYIFFVVFCQGFFCNNFEREREREREFGGGGGGGGWGIVCHYRFHGHPCRA